MLLVGKQLFNLIPQRRVFSGDFIEEPPAFAGRPLQSRMEKFLEFLPVLLVHDAAK